jgi:hypothetical protein
VPAPTASTASNWFLLPARQPQYSNSGHECQREKKKGQIGFHAMYVMQLVYHGGVARIQKNPTEEQSAGKIISRVHKFNRLVFRVEI